MENQHRQIKGYRELTADEIELMNEIKTKGAELGELVAKLRAKGGLDQSQVERMGFNQSTGMGYVVVSDWIARQKGLSE